MRNREKSSTIAELDGRVSNLAEATKKPFDVLAEGLLAKDSRDDTRWTFPNDLSAAALLHRAVAQVHEFKADEFHLLVQNYESDRANVSS